MIVNNDQSEIVCADADEVFHPKIDTITPGMLTENKVELTKHRAGETGLVTVTFQLDNPLPADGAIAITFPEGFSFEEFAEATLSKFDGSLAEGPVTVEDLTTKAIEHDDGKTTVLLTRTGGDRIADGRLVTVELTDITNPRVSGPTQHFEIRTSLGKQKDE